MKILYLVGGKSAIGGGATVRDAMFVRGLADAGHEVVALSVMGQARVEGSEEDSRLFTPLVGGGVSHFFPALSRMLSALVSLWRHPRPIRSLTSFAVGGYVDRAGPALVGILAGRDKNLRDDFAKCMEQVESNPPNPDIVVLSSPVLSALAEPLRANLGCPVVCLTQGADRHMESLEEPFRSDARKLVRRNARNFAIAVATSRHFAIRATEFMALPASRVKVVPPGIDAEAFANPSPRVRSPFVIGYCDGIRQEKGLDTLVDALDQLIKSGSTDVELHIAGKIDDSRYWQRIKRRLESPLLSGRHKVYGELGRKARKEFLAGLSVYATSTREPESKGLVILEAMALGVPVTAPSSGIIPEIFQLVNGGLLVSSEAPVWMYAQAFELLASMPETADSLGKNAARGVAEHFSISRAAERLSNILVAAVRAGEAAKPA
ncbi:MAG: glycosyltransferase family 4 protein [Planctomycetota bacterium]|jgi:glycosyltransferase involved in cell wall biosynthesis|nr:glycosyltransferase family 4 protein [Planctomycetota bacterium]